MESTIKPIVYLNEGGKRRLHPIYNAWQAIKRKCTSHLHPYWDCNGAIGVTVYKSWMNDYKKFYIWSIKNGWRIGLHLNRKNTKRNYIPSNLYWGEIQKNARAVRYLNLDKFCKLDGDLLIYRASLLTGYTKEQILSNSRQLELVQIRTAISVILNKVYGIVSIKKLFNLRSHSSVINLIKKSKTVSYPERYKQFLRLLESGIYTKEEVNELKEMFTEKWRLKQRSVKYNYILKSIKNVKKNLQYAA